MDASMFDGLWKGLKAFIVILFIAGIALGIVLAIGIPWLWNHISLTIH